MSWPFTNGTVAPTFDVGPEEVATASPDVLTESDGWLIGAHFQNTGDTLRTLVVTDRDGKELIGPIDIPAGAPYGPLDLAFMPFHGLRWGAGAGLIGHLWGYEDA